MISRALRGPRAGRAPLPHPQMNAAPTEEPKEPERCAAWLVLANPPYRRVFVLKEVLSFGFSQELPGAVQPVLGHKLKQAVLPAGEAHGAARTGVWDQAGLGCRDWGSS